MPSRQPTLRSTAAIDSDRSGSDGQRSLDPAANEPCYCHGAQSAQTSPPDAGSHEATSLAFPFLFSLMLHFGLVLAVSATMNFTPVGDSSPPVLTATFSSLPKEMPPPEPTITSTDAIRIADSRDLPEPLLPRNPSSDTAQGIAGDANRQARFLVDPDLSILEEIPAAGPGVISLQLSITALGNVERVTVVRSDPVPRELLDGLVERFGKAKLSPAIINGKAAASSLAITIRVDPGAQLLEPLR